METIEQRKRRAISPVIATVILVAVAITVAVGVSYWMSGIAGQYTAFEKVEIQTGYATYDSTDSLWTITMAIKNSGSSDATINMVFLNDVPCVSPTNYGIDEHLATPTKPLPAGTWGVNILETGVTLQPGEDTTILVFIDNPCDQIPELASLSAGTTVNAKLHSAGGMDYIKLIKLP